jgi:hypothetical protein
MQFIYFQNISNWVWIWLILGQILTALDAPVWSFVEHVTQLQLALEIILKIISNAYLKMLQH